MTGQRFVIRIIGRGSAGASFGGTGEYVRRFDPDGGDPAVAYPTGLLETTPDHAEALAFDTAGDALDCWRCQSRRTPLRPDGRPNRPMAALTVEVTQRVT